MLGDFHLSRSPLAEQVGHLYALGHRAAPDRGRGRRGLLAQRLPLLLRRPSEPGASAAVWQKRLTDLFQLPPLFDPDRDR